jgi:GTP cyclohydrolase II
MSNAFADSIVGRPAAGPLAVDRATGELRRGQPVLLAGADGAACLAAAAETIEDAVLDRLRQAADRAVFLVLTRRRAALLGLAAGGAGAVALPIATSERAENLARLADPSGEPARLGVVGASGPPALGTLLAAAAIELAKLARLLPAAIVAPLSPRFLEDPRRQAIAPGLLAVDAADIAAYQTAAAVSLHPVGEARVPLEGAEATRVVAFRPSDGSIEHLAIVIGEPNPARPVLARLHSECFTGDLLGSLRCDCGDQLRGAISEIARQGSGVLLYLAQEGRGIGLVNKLRAYRLQDSGSDTADANEQLGFEADERIYLPAAEMLRRLGFHQVRLMTNNPAKVAGLKRCGIEVVERVPLVVPPNPHNRDYLGTKAAKLGHMF